MKRPVLTIIFTAVILLLFSGCFGGNSTYAEAVAKFQEAEGYIKDGNIAAADDCLTEACGLFPSESSYKRCLTLLSQGSGLDFLRDGFPSKDELMFEGKPLSEYSSQDLLDMAGINTIGYHNEAGLTSTLQFSGSSENEDDIQLPYGIKPSMNVDEMLMAIGFTEKETKLITNLYYISIECSENGFAIDAKKSNYAAFSQHPAESWVFTIRNGSTQLSFSNSGDSLESYTITVYI